MRFVMILLVLSGLLMALPIAGAETVGSGDPAPVPIPEARDICTPEAYDNAAGVIYSREPDGAYSVWGNCNPQGCQKITTVNPNTFVTITTLRGFRRYAGAASWYIDAYYMGAEGTAQVYQLNVYNGAGILQEDGFWVSMFNDGTTAWRSEVCTGLSSRIRVTSTSIGQNTMPTLPTYPTTATTYTVPSHSQGDGGATVRAAGTFSNGIYTVAAGDNLYRIGLRFGVSIQAIISANGLTNMNVIYAGQQLRIP